MTDLERDDRALIEALKAELIEARNQAETRSIHNARLRSERDVAMEEVERLNGVTEALEKTVKALIAQHREAKDGVERLNKRLEMADQRRLAICDRLDEAVAENDYLRSELGRERARLKSACDGCARTARNEMDSILASLGRQVEQREKAEAEVARLREFVVWASEVRWASAASNPILDEINLEYVERARAALAKEAPDGE